MDLKSGETVDVTAGESSGAAAGRFSSGGGVAPDISPDGRWLAFARQIPDGLLEFKGHKYGPRTALWLRDMKIGKRTDDDGPDRADGRQSAPKRSACFPATNGPATVRVFSSCRAVKLRRLDVATGDVTTIPFTAKVHRTMSQMARNEFRITDDPLAVKFFRWPTATPDGATLAFQAVGHIWMQDGERRRAAARHAGRRSLNSSMRPRGAPTGVRSPS